MPAATVRIFENHVPSESNIASGRWRKGPIKYQREPHRYADSRRGEERARAREARRAAFAELRAEGFRCVGCLTGRPRSLHDDDNAALTRTRVIERPLRLRDCRCVLATDLAVDGVAMANGAMRVTRCTTNRKRVSTMYELGRQNIVK